MAWQDEVRRLDEELAAGRLSPDEHQRRRDELTAQGDTEQAEQNPPAQTDRLTPATSEPGATPPGQDADAGQGNQNSPFPPAFRWESTTPPNETTQVINPVSGSDAERTQVVRSPAPPPPPVDDSERTQVVQAGPPAPPRFGAPSYSGDYPGGDEQWAQQESAPPWVSSEPIQEPNAGWMMQGPESFEAEPAESGTMRIVAVAAAVVVLLAVGIGAYFLFQPGGSSTTAGDERSTAAEPPAPAPPPGGDALAPGPKPPPGPAPEPQPQGPPIASLPGEQLDTSEFRDFAQVRQLGYYTEGELETMYAAGPGEAALALSTRDDNKLIILVVRADDPVTARDGLADLQLQFELDELDGPAGVRVAGSDNVSSGDPVLRRAHYASGDYVIRVQASGNSASEVEQLFEEILSSQQQELAADG